MLNDYTVKTIGKDLGGLSITQLRVDFVNILMCCTTFNFLAMDNQLNNYNFAKQILIKTI